MAAERGIPIGGVERLVDAATHGRSLGFIGDPWVNVLDLNLALDEEFGGAR